MRSFRFLMPVRILNFMKMESLDDDLNMANKKYKITWIRMKLVSTFKKNTEGFGERVAFVNGLGLWGKNILIPTTHHHR